MPQLFLFLFKINLAIVLFYAIYYCLLKQFTFYRLNRFYLLFAIIFSTLYPLVDFGHLLAKHQEVALPIRTIVLVYKVPTEKIIRPIERQYQNFDYWHIAEALFWFISSVVFIRLLSKFYSLYKFHKVSKPFQINNYSVRKINADTGPFSFWKTIYINPDDISEVDLRNILTHEQVHVNQFHTIDIFLSELCGVVYWFNPFVWLLARSIKENLEFVTDSEILRQGVDTKIYQYSLLNINFKELSPIALTNQFNMSTLKKRIVMMNKKRTSPARKVIYIFVVPFLSLFILGFNVSLAGSNVRSTANQLVRIVQPLIKGPDKENVLINSKVIRTKKANNEPSAQHSNLSKIDSAKTAFYLDGVLTNKDVINQLDRKLIDRTFVLFGDEVYKKYHSQSLLCVITIKNKDSKVVRSFINDVSVMETKNEEVPNSTVGNKAIAVTPSRITMSGDQTPIVSNYLITISDYNPDQISQIVADLSAQGFTLNARPEYVSGQLAKLTLAISSGRSKSSGTWTVNDDKKSDAFLIKTDSGTGLADISILSK